MEKNKKNKKSHKNRYKKIEKRIEELERINKKLLSESMETYNVAIINMEKIKELKCQIKRNKFEE